MPSDLSPNLSPRPRPRRDACDPVGLLRRARSSSTCAGRKAARAALQGPDELAQLVLGNAAAETLLAIALGRFARVLGYELSLAELIVQSSVALRFGLIPVYL